MFKGETWMNIKNDRLKGLTYKEIGRIHNIDQRTAKKYATSDSRPKYKRKHKESALEKYKPLIIALLDEAPYTSKRITEIVNKEGCPLKRTSINNFVKTIKEHKHKEATIRFETIPGCQGQVDWGFFENYLVYENGEYKKLYCFLMILGYSRMRYIEFVTEMSTTTLLRCHNNAFRYFNGYPNEILYDNMKQVVIKRLLKADLSEFNKEFEDYAGFYGFKPVLCRPYRGQTKGKVERTVQYVRRDFMVGIKYQDLEDLNKQALKWCEKINHEVHHTTNKIPYLRLNEENLNPILRECIIDKTNLRKVQKDCMISYGTNKYSVPSEYAERIVTVIVLDNIMCIYSEGKQIATHKLSLLKNQMIMNKEHYRLINYPSLNYPLNTLLQDGLDSIVTNIKMEKYDE